FLYILCSISSFLLHFFFLFFFYCYRDLRDLHSFPTRRSSDLDHRVSAGHLRAVLPVPQSSCKQRINNFRQTMAEVVYSLLDWIRSEEHTSELQSLRHLVCRLLLEKKKKKNNYKKYKYKL